jgi:hypothetical protein
MVSCTLPEMANWWKQHGVEVEPIFEDSLGGYTYWKVDAPEVDERCKDPKYVELMIREQAMVVQLTRKKFSPPLLFLRKDGYPANMMEPSKILSAPVSKDRAALLALLSEAHGISIGTCGTQHEVEEFLRDSIESGVKQIVYVLREGLTERFDPTALLRITSA